MKNSEIDFLLMKIARACELGEIDNVILLSKKLKEIKITRNKTYLCSYSTGDCEYYTEYNVFVTDDIEKAKNWVIKINNLAEKAKKHFKYMDKNYKPCKNILYSFNCAEYKEIESR